MKLTLFPRAPREDKGEGGVARTAFYQERELQDLGFFFEDDPAKADVVACHIMIPDDWKKLVAKKPLVEHCHGLYWAEFEWKDWHRSANDGVRAAILQADVTTVPSPWVARIIERQFARTPFVIPHGVDMKEWATAGKQGYVLWDKNRPDPVCDPRPAQEIADLMPTTQFKMTFVSEDYERPNVEVLGRRPYAEAREWTLGASVYLATTMETFGIATLQALAAGVPVVAFKHGANPDLVEHGVTGWLVEPGDYMGAARGIQWALAEGRNVAQACRESAAKYSWKKAGALYAEAYEEAIRRRTRGPRVSVVVPSFNLGRYLDGALMSVVRQSEQDLECIVVDDASTDESVAIAERFEEKDPRFHLLQHEKNEGTSLAKNHGIEDSRGRYVICLDADDELHPNAVKVLADALDADRSIAVAYAPIRFVDEEMEPIVYRGHEHEPGVSGWPYEFDWWQQIHGKNMVPYYAMFRREAWEGVGGYRPRLTVAEDADLWARMSSYGFRPAKVTEEPLLTYRVRKDSLSRTNAMPDWSRWYGWRDEARRAPAGACSKDSLPIPMLQPPALSVVIPVGPGHESHVLTALDSLEAQDWLHYEAIVVNDTGHPLRLPKWARVIDTPQPGSGPAVARNLGVTASRAKMYLPLDADDYLQPHALGLLWQAHRKHPADVLYPDWWEDNKEGRFTVWENRDFDPRTLIYDGMLGSVTALVPKQIWSEVGGYDEGQAFEDWDFQLMAVEAGYCMRRVALPLFTYRKHTGMRRESAYAHRAASRDLVADKRGGSSFDPKEWVMACGCSKGKTTTVNPVMEAMSRASTPGAPDTSGMVLLRYDGDMEAAVEYRGRATRQGYVFGKGDQRYVWAADAKGFLELDGFSAPSAPSVEAGTGPVLVA